MAYSLVALYKTFICQTHWLQEQFEAPLPTDRAAARICSPLHGLSRELCAIRLLDTWARFCRELVICSAARRPVTASGRVLPLAPGIRNPKHVIPSLLASYAKKRYEPRWHDAAECIDAARRLRVANLPMISLALGTTPSPAKDLRLVRNFVAHQCQDTAHKLNPLLKFLGLPANATPEQVLQQPVLGGTCAYITWIYQLRLIARNAVA
jgi:hypothetical protein